MINAYFEPEQLLHRPKSYFSRGKMRTPQEVPERAMNLVAAAADFGMKICTPTDQGMDPLIAVHGEDYLRFLETAHSRWRKLPADWGEEVMSNIYVRERNALRGVLAEAACYLADGSCPVGAFTWRSAYWSAQTAIAGARDIMDGGQQAYSICRPPGHHARRQAAGGFCYLNNAAIAAQTLRRKFSRVLILDTDMHHGQGTQEIFYSRNDVYYVSIHGDPTNFYPAVAGFDDERGCGPGLGFNLNVPIVHGADEETYFKELASALRTCRDYAPDVLVLSLGFDIYKEDPQAMVSVSSEGFERLGREISALQVPVQIVQEGGYHLKTLGINLGCFFRGLTMTVQ